MQAREKPRLLRVIKTYDELQNQLEREEEEKESYKAGCIELESLLNAAEAAKDKLGAQFDAEVEVKYVGIIFMHCDTL